MDNYNYNYLENSPCINSGDPSDVDADGTRRDIGAAIYFQNSNLIGDCNIDATLNILDVIYIINNCINDTIEGCVCGDINEDNEVNILDVVLLINLILNN